MSNTRYLEITSEFRNRNLYPLPAQFNIDISQTGIKDKADALDPVSFAAPLITFAGQFDANTAAALFVSGTVSSTVAAPVGGLGNSTSPQNIVVTFVAGDLVTTNGFYNGAILLITTATTTERRRILSYEYVSTTQGIFTVTDAFSNAVIDGDAVDIAIPSDNNATTPKMFIPTGSNADNYYVNYILEDVTLSEFRTITAYDGTTHLASIDSAFGGAWAATDSFVVRRERPCDTGTLANPAAPNTNTTSFLITSTTQKFLGDFIRVTSGGNNDEIRRIVKYQEPISGVLATGTSTTQFNLSSAFSPVNNHYTGFFITIDSGTAAGDVRLINSYTITSLNNIVTTRVGVPESPFTAGIDAGDSFTIHGGIVSPAMPAVFAGASTYEILAFTRDNSVPFNYVGSMVSQQEEVCYEIELLNLTLPNQTLAVGKGSKITFYPYIYVELANVSSSGAGSKGAIYSNNPNATKMLFRCAIDDIANPLSSPFIKIDGDGTIMTIKFKANCDMKFSVRLPNGEVFQTTASENFSPLPPNPIHQISALFSLRRL